MEAQARANNIQYPQEQVLGYKGGRTRDRIAWRIIKLSIWILIGLGVLAVASIFMVDGEKRFDLLQFVFAAIVPVVGTWMGTVLAFYFSKENLDAANRSVSALVRHITSNEKLQSISAMQAMIPKSKIFFFPLPSTKKLEEVKLSELLKFMHGKEISRLPILDENGFVRFMFHRSVLDGFIAEKALSGQPINPPAPLEGLTLHDLVNSDSPKFKKILEQAWQFVKPESNLAEAQEKIEKNDVCQDVFVTPNGTANEPILGWITNTTVAEHARV